MPSPFPTGGPSSPLPQPPTVSLPSPGSDPTAGGPSMPSLPSSEDGSSDASMPGMPSDGQGGENSSEGEEGSDGDSDGSAGEVVESSWEIPDGDPEDVESEELVKEIEEGSAMPGSLLPGTGESEGDSGWEISNQLPAPGDETSEGEEQGGVEGLPGEIDQVSDGEGVDQDERLLRALEAMDREIMAERMDSRIRSNERVAGTDGLLGEPELDDAQLEEAGEGGEGSDVSDDAQTMDENEGDGQQNLPPTMRTEADGADARDDDVVARQLREAAMAEEDPKLKEELWEEYRKYKDGT